MASLKPYWLDTKVSCFFRSPQLIAVASLKQPQIGVSYTHDLRSPQLIAVASLKPTRARGLAPCLRRISTANRCGLVEARFAFGAGYLSTRSPQLIAVASLKPEALGLGIRGVYDLHS